jgi:hypothetical protein
MLLLSEVERCRGTHAFCVLILVFDSIELKHTARSREGWALGAILGRESGYLKK